MLVCFFFIGFAQVQASENCVAQNQIPQDKLLADNYSSDVVFVENIVIYSDENGKPHCAGEGTVIWSKSRRQYVAYLNVRMGMPSPYVVQINPHYGNKSVWYGAFRYCYVKNSNSNWIHYFNANNINM